ncbi:ParB/Srx family N-terminal domain-containing protein [Streptomyces kanamyceticus]|uniref:Chromosome partitioning protein ParB n=2 Tax=Streptomyces kanamyceticus TaxID=1967 RepID=A0A5J6GBA5_STRKN|nr:ParB/Srx family N-terminal domain-containing protein [Streptomyces kanamyceticus]QEU90546.1 chromosome partitioning protein ParB [Streptomyces kanamyceticus]
MTNVKTQASVQTAPAPWPTLAAAELAAHPGNFRDIEAPADLLADVKGNGVVEPLYVVRTHGDVPQIIDGFQRLAAALAAGLEAVPVTPRPVIRIDALTPHPENAREDLDINAPFVDSLRCEGCRIPVKIQRLDGGVLQVNDGNRRYFGGQDAGLTHLPYEWEDDDRDAAGQFLDMITTAQHRKPLTQGEMTAAMFSAAEAGAQVGRIAKAAGVRQKDVKTVVKVKNDKALSGAVANSAYAWTFDQLAALSEFADDAEALTAITKAAEDEDAADEIDWTIQIERTKREKQAKAEAHRAELEKAGQKVRDMTELSERATPVWRLRTPDGERITTEDHAECQGQVWVLEEDDDEKLKPYCTSPVLYGHAEPGSSLGGNGTKNAAEKEAEKAARAAVKKGNLEWDAAEGRRRQWLADMVKRRNLPKDTTNTLTAHINAALLAGTWGICDDLNKEPTTEILATLLGITGDKAKYRTNFPDHVAKDPRRAVQLQWAALAAVREKHATRSAWRTDAQRAPWARNPTGRWFEILEALGYQLTPIEQAVKDDEPYDPYKKKRAAITASAAPEQADQMPADGEQPAADAAAA